MWLGSPSNSWQSCVGEMHGVNRCFLKGRINFPLTLGSGFHPLLFKEPRKWRANPVQLFMCSHSQLAKKYQNSLCLSRTDAITETKGWKRLPFSQVQATVFDSLISTWKKWAFYFFSSLFFLFWLPLMLMAVHSWSSVLWFGRFYQEDDILRVRNSSSIKAPKNFEEV